MLMLSLLLLALPHISSFAVAQDQRYPPFARCIEGTTASDRLGCVVCDVTVTVDPLTGTDCGPAVQTDRSLSSAVCTELEAVIHSISMMDTVHRPDGCIEVLIEPKGAAEAYVVNRDGNRVIRQNVVFRRASNPTTSNQAEVRVTFLEPSEAPVVTETGAVQYALQFRESSLFGVNGVRFDESPARIGVEDVSVVVVESSIFQYFTRGALDVYNCPTVLVSETEFLHNGPFTTQLLQEYRGDSAGLSVALNPPMSVSNTPFKLTVHNCTFRNNSVGVGSVVIATNETADETTNPPDDGIGSENNDNNNDKKGSSNFDSPSRGGMFEAVGGVVVGLQFTSRGGGLAVIVNDDDPADVEVWGCEFIENGALAFGGGMYVGLDGRSRHSVVISHTEFHNNSSPSTGGGLQISFLKEGQPGFNNRVVVMDTTFHDNDANYGGGVFFLPIDIDPSSVEGFLEVGVFVQFERCSFIGNHAEEVGGAFGGAFHILSYNTRALNFINCTFDSNSVGGVGVVSTAFYPISFHGNNRFINNRGNSLSVIGSRVSVFGELLFRDNTNQGGGQDQGALYVTSQGQIELKQGATVSFVNNAGITGAGLYVEAPHVPQLFSKLGNNPLCVLLFEDGALSPDNWHTANVSLRFIDNEAMVSSAVYINNLDLCSWTSLSPPYFNRQGVFYWEFVSLIDNVNRVHKDSTDPLWAVQTPPVRVDIQQEEGVDTTCIFQIPAFPGQRINLRLTGLDERDLVTAVSARMDVKGADFRFQPSSITLDLVNTSSSVSYFISDALDDSEVTRGVTADSLLKPNRRTVAQDSFEVTSRHCPAGLKLISAPGNEGLSVCTCDEDRPEILTCNRQEITLNTHLWGSVGSLAGNLETFSCPSGYCGCVIQNTSGQLECNFVFDAFQPNKQCGCNRTGILCGDCPDDTGFTVLLSQCDSCDSLFYLLIPLLVLIDTVIIVLLLVLMLPVPMWLYPVICYLQLLPHFTEFFPITFELVRPYLLYVVSATGLYFPYDFCLSEDLDAVGAYALRYLPPLLAMTVSIVVILIRSKVTRPCCWHGVWWLVLLLYTPTLHTSLTILNCPALPAIGDETWVPRWTVNGNIECFNGTHIPLGILAILVLGVCVALIPLCILLSLKKLTFPRWLRFLVNPLTDAYKEEYKWWSGIELIKRVILVLFSVVLPNNDIAVILLLMIILTVCSYCKPYKHWSVNILDLILACDILIMLLLRNTSYLEDELPVLTMNITSIGLQGTCVTTVDSITAIVALLTPFYYFPLALAVGIVIVWSLYHAFVWLRQQQCQLSSEKGKKPLRGASLRFSQKGEAVQAHTQTVIDLNELDPEDSVPLSKEMLQLEELPSEKKPTIGERTSTIEDDISDNISDTSV